MYKTFINIIQINFPFISFSNSFKDTIDVHNIINMNYSSYVEKQKKKNNGK
jgi:hypothetical protein